MTTPLKNLQKEAQLLRLSSQEKELLHANIMRRVRAQEGGTAAAPRMTPSPFFFFIAPKFAASFAALLLIVIGGGTAFAAKGALPGDPLYALKTKVNEPIQGALAFSLEDKIQFHAEVAQTRLEEAEVLASQNRLDEKAAAALESSLDAHLEERNKLAQALDEQKPNFSAKVSSRFESSISAHGDVLLALGEGSASSSTRQNSNVIASKVRFARVNTNNSGTMALAMAKTAPQAPASNTPEATTMSLTLAVAEDTATATSGEDFSAVENQQVNRNSRSRSNSDDTKDMQEALSLGLRATSSLQKLTASVEALKGKVDADVEAKLDARLSKMASLVAEGEAALGEKNYDDAKDSFDEAIDRGVTLSTFISANQRFDNGILKLLLGNDSHWGDD